MFFKVLTFYLMMIMLKNAIDEEHKLNPNHDIHNFYWSSSRGWPSTHFIPISNLSGNDQQTEK